MVAIPSGISGTLTTRTNIMGRLLHKLSPKWEIVPEIAFVPLLIVYLLHSVVVCFGVCATKLSAITWIRLNYNTYEERRGD